MKVLAFLLAVALAPVALAEGAADLIARLPEDAGVVLVSEDAPGVMDRFMGLADEGVFPLPAGARETAQRMRESAAMLVGPWLLAVVQDPEGASQLVAVARLKVTEEEALEDAHERWAPVREEPDVGPGVYSHRGIIGPMRLFSLVRDSILYQSTSAEHLPPLVEAQPNPDSELSTFYREAGLAERAQGGLALLLGSERVADALRDTGLIDDDEEDADAGVRLAWFQALRPMAPSLKGPAAVIWSWSDHASGVQLVARLSETTPLWEALAGREETEALARVALPPEPLVLAGNFRDFAGGVVVAEFLIETFSLGLQAGFRNRLAAFNQAAGIDVERDILGALDGTWSATLALGEEGRPSIRRLVLGVEDIQGLRDSLRAVARHAQAPWEEGVGVVTEIMGRPAMLEFNQEGLHIGFLDGERPELGEPFDWIGADAFRPVFEPRPPAIALCGSVGGLLRAAPAPVRVAGALGLGDTRHAVLAIGVHDETLSVRLDVAPRIEPVFAFARRAGALMYQAGGREREEGAATQPPSLQQRRAQVDPADLGDILFEAEDLFDEWATWRGYEWGALVTGGVEGWRDFRNILGERNPEPSSVAFSDAAVWLGTRRGFFRWDRAGKYWNRISVGGQFFDAPVLEMEMRDNLLEVTVDVNGQRRTSVFDIQARRWR